MGDSRTEAPIWWSVAAFAKLVGLSRQAVYKWIRKGKLNVSTVGDSYRITRAGLRRDDPELYESILMVESEIKSRASRSGVNH